MSESTPTDASFRSQRHGRTRHLVLETADDLCLAADLPEGHWVATAAPVAVFRADPVLLDALDGDDDGRIRARDVKQAIRWLFERLPDAVRLGTTEVDPDEVDASSEDGRRIRTAASKIEPPLTLERVRGVREQTEAEGLSAAGLALPAAAEEPAVKQLVEDILATVGGREHPLGGQAVAVEDLDRFLAQVAELLDWLEGGAGDDRSPLGDATGAAWESCVAARDKVEQFFTLCDAVRLDPRLADRVWPDPDRVEGDLTDAGAVADLLREAPVARPGADGVLDLEGALNPAWAPVLHRLRDAAVLPLLDTPHLDREGWRSLGERLAAYGAWVEARPEVSVDVLPDERLRAYRADPAPADQVRALIEQSHGTSLVADDVRLLERLLVYQAHLLDFCNSFVSFPDLYDPESRALFERGTLIMDGREFSLAVPVTDRDRHVRFTDASNMFTLYVEVLDRSDHVLHEVAVPVTSGGRGNLLSTKWGIFHDLEGNEHHARVIRIVDNPISLWEAVIAPFVRLGDAVTGMIDKMGAQETDALVAKGTGGVGRVQEQARADAGGAQAAGAQAPAAPAAPQAPAPAGQVAGGPAALLAGGGIAFAAVGSSMAFIAQVVGKVGWPAIAGGVAVMLGFLLVPVVIVAWLRLRRRDLSSLLEGSGWAVNARMRLTRQQAHTFTRRPRWPGLRSGTPWLVAVVIVAFLGLLAWTVLA